MASLVIVVERSGCGRAERVPPHRADVGEPNTDDPEGGAGYLTSDFVPTGANGVLSKDLQQV